MLIVFVVGIDTTQNTVLVLHLHALSCQTGAKIERTMEFYQINFRHIIGGKQHRVESCLFYHTKIVSDLVVDSLFTLRYWCVPCIAFFHILYSVFACTNFMCKHCTPCVWCFCSYALLCTHNRLSHRRLVHP